MISTQAAIKSNTLLRNGAYGIVMRGVQKCTRGCSSLRSKNYAPLHCIILDTATDPACGTGGFLTSTIAHIGKINSTEELELLQTTINGWEKKPLPYLLAMTNLL